MLINNIKITIIILNCNCPLLIIIKLIFLWKNPYHFYVGYDLDPERKKVFVGFTRIRRERKEIKTVPFFSLFYPSAPSFQVTRVL